MSVPLVAKCLNQCHRCLPLLRCFLRRSREDRLPVLAGHLAYVTLLSLVPMVAVVFAVLAYLPAFAQVQQQLERFVFDNFVPTAGEVIHDYLLTFVGNASRTTSFGLLALMVVALLLISAIDENLNHIWRSRGKRRLATTIAVYWLVLTLGPLLVGASLLATSYVVSLRLFDGELMVGVMSRLLGLFPLLLSFCAMLFIYLLVPNVKVRLRHALIGALIAALLFEGAKKGFAFYITQFTSYQLIYGALAAIPILFVWVYLSWLIVLLGAEVTATLGEQARGDGPQWD